MGFLSPKTQKLTIEPIWTGLRTPLVIEMELLVMEQVKVELRFDTAVQLFLARVGLGMKVSGGRVTRN